MREKGVRWNPDYLREVRKKNGFSQNDLATLICDSADGRIISKWESKHPKFGFAPSAYHLVCLGIVLGLKTEDLTKFFVYENKKGGE